MTKIVSKRWFIFPADYQMIVLVKEVKLILKYYVNLNRGIKEGKRLWYSVDGI